MMNLTRCGCRIDSKKVLGSIPANPDNNGLVCVIRKFCVKKKKNCPA